MRSLLAFRLLAASRRFSGITTAGLLALLSGCGAASSPMTMMGAATSRFCEYSDFSVDVTAGPSAGLRLAGALLLEEVLATGELSGSLKIADGSRIPVSGSVYKSGDIALTFHTKLGYVMGLGKLGDNFCKAGTTIAGVAVGPRIASNNMIGGSDSGHWLLAGSYQLNPVTVDYTISEPLNPSLITLSGGSTTYSITCQEGAMQVSGSCCAGNVGGGGTATTCVSGGVTCTTTRSNGATTADTCCNGPKPPGSAVPDCMAGQSQIQS